MANPEKVVLKIVSVKGTCVAGHYAGQEFNLSKDFLLGLSGETHGPFVPLLFMPSFPHGGCSDMEENTPGKRIETRPPLPAPIHSIPW